MFLSNNSYLTNFSSAKRVARPLQKRGGTLRTPLRVSLLGCSLTNSIWRGPIPASPNHVMDDARGWHPAYLRAAINPTLEYEIGPSSCFAWGCDFYRAFLKSSFIILTLKVIVGIGGLNQNILSNILNA